MKNCIFFIIITFFILQCKRIDKTDASSKTNLIYSNIDSDPDQNLEEAETYQTNSNYKYEYRTGRTGDYQYNYDIEGYDTNGNSVNGNIDISGKYGSGYIYDEDGNEINIEVEWVDYGELEGVDEDGNYYELNVE